MSSSRAAAIVTRWRLPALWLLLYTGIAFLRLAPLSLQPGRRLVDDGDAPLNVWTLWWASNHLFAGRRLFDANAFYPHPGGLLYNEPLLAQSLLARPLFAALDNPVLISNLVLIATIGLGAFAFHLLARELTGSSAAAAAAACLYAFNCTTLSDLARLQLVSIQWLPLALLALHLFFVRSQARYALAFAAFSILHGLSCFYYLLFYLVALAILLPAYVWAGRAWTKPRLLILLGGLGLACGLVLGAAAFPYFRLYRQYGFATRPASPFDLALYLFPPRDSLVYRGLGDALRPGGYYVDHFLGYAALALAALGLLAVARRDRRTRFDAVWVAYAAMGIAALLLSAGPEIVWRGETYGPGPFALIRGLGPFAKLREPRRFALLVNLSLALFVACGAAAVLSRMAAGSRAAVAALLAILLAGEHVVPRQTRGTAIPAGSEVPEAYRWLAARTGAEPLVELPIRPTRLVRFAALDQYFATIHGKPTMMGWASFVPPALERLRSDLRGFPDHRSLVILRALGVRLAVVHPRKWEGERRFYARRLAASAGSMTLLGRFPERDLPTWNRYLLGGEEVYALPPLPEEQPPRPCDCRPIDRRGMRVAASVGGDPQAAMDGRRETKWSTPGEQREGQFFEIIFDRPRRPARIEIEMSFPYGEFAWNPEILGLRDGEARPIGPVPDLWAEVLLLRQLVTEPTRARLRYDLAPSPVDGIRLVLGPTEEAANPWSIAEVHVYESGGSGQAALPQARDRGSARPRASPVTQYTATSPARIAPPTARAGRGRSRTSSSRRGLLLRQAVERAQAPHEIDRVDPHHRPIADQLGEHAQSSAIRGVVERRDDRRGVGHVEVRVAGGQALAGEDEGRRHGQRDDLRPRAVLETGALEALPVLLQRTMVGVGGIGLAAGHQRAGPDEATDVVHVAVGVVAGHAAAQPNHVRGAQDVPEDVLVFAPSEARVANLALGVEQALLGGDERTSAVDVDAPALEDDVATVPRRGSHGEAEVARRPGGDPRVLPAVRILGPGVEAEPGDPDLAASRRAPHEDGAEVPRPSAVGGPTQELDLAQGSAHLVEHLPRTLLVSGRVHQDAHRLAGGDLADDLAVHPRDGREPARPVGQLVGPAEPGGLVAVPLGGQAELRRRRDRRPARAGHAVSRGSGGRGRRTHRSSDRGGRASCAGPPPSARGPPRR